MLETNKIHCGDCLELLFDIEDESIDLVIADPPYRTTQYRTKEKWGEQIKDLSLRKGMDSFNAEWDRFNPKEYKEFTDSWIPEIYRVLRQKGTAFIHCILTGEWMGFPEIINACKKTKFKLLNNIAWCKPNGQPIYLGLDFHIQPNKSYGFQKREKEKEFLIIRR